MPEKINANSGEVIDRCDFATIGELRQSDEKHGRTGAMAIELSDPHVEKVDGQPARLRKTPRVRIAQLVMDYLAQGWSADEMCRQHDYLTPAEAHAALLYYRDHNDEIDKEISDE